MMIRLQGNVFPLRPKKVDVSSYTPPVNRQADIPTPRVEREAFHGEGPSIQRIKEAAAGVFGVTVFDIESDRRSRKFVAPRWAVIHAARILTRKSYPQIGRELGHRDHTTVMYALEMVEKRIASNPEYAAKVAAVVAISRDSN